MDQLSPQDAAALKMLAGATFGPNSKLTLPSGREIDPDEAQALTSAYAPAIRGMHLIGHVILPDEGEEPGK